MRPCEVKNSEDPNSGFTACQVRHADLEQATGSFLEPHRLDGCGRWLWTCLLLRSACIPAEVLPHQAHQHILYLEMKVKAGEELEKKNEDG